mgnify:CR=1 FL=1
MPAPSSSTAISRKSPGGASILSSRRSAEPRLRASQLILIFAAIAGDQMNYSIGRYFGPKVWQWEHSRFFNKRAFNQAHEFYEKYGGITIMLARFLPFIRTFVPFVAGVAEMSRRKFTMYNIAGALVWVISLTLLGYFFGNLPWAKANMSLIIWLMIIVPGLIAMGGAWKARRNAERGTP